MPNAPRLSRSCAYRRPPEAWCGLSVAYEPHFTAPRRAALRFASLTRMRLPDADEPDGHTSAPYTDASRLQLARLR